MAPDTATASTYPIFYIRSSGILYNTTGTGGWPAYGNSADWPPQSSPPLVDPPRRKRRGNLVGLCPAGDDSRLAAAPLRSPPRPRPRVTTPAWPAMLKAFA
jgi:hypothetical protein